MFFDEYGLINAPSLAEEGFDEYGLITPATLEAVERTQVFFDEYGLINAPSLTEEGFDAGVLRRRGQDDAGGDRALLREGDYLCGDYAYCASVDKDERWCSRVFLHCHCLRVEYNGQVWQVDVPDVPLGCFVAWVACCP